MTATTTVPATHWIIWDTYNKKTVIGGFASSAEAYAWIDNHYPHKKGYTVREVEKNS